MKFSKHEAVSALILLLLVILGILWIITTDSISWSGLFGIVMTILGVIGTFLQWRFPPSVDTKKALTSSNDNKQNAESLIITDPFQRHKLEEQKFQVVDRENRKKRAKRNKIIFLISFIVISVCSLGALFYSQLVPQLYLINHDDDYRNRITSTSWSPRGELIASTTLDGSVRIWNVAKGITSLIYSSQSQSQVMYNDTTHGYNNVSWSPNGEYIVFGNNDNKIRIADISVPQNSQITYLNVGNLGVVNTVAWSPNGKYIAFGGESGIVYVKELNNKQTIVKYSKTAPISTLAWSQNGKLIASGGSDGEVHVWDVATDKDVFDTPNYSGEVTSLVWSPTSSSLFASSSSDSQVDVWDISKKNVDNPLVPYPKHEGSVNSLAWSPDGNEIASGGNGGNLHIWNAFTGVDLNVYHDFLHPYNNNTFVSVSAIGWSSDGKSLTIGHNEDDRYGGYSNYYTIEEFKFCSSWCLLR